MSDPGHIGYAYHLTPKDIGKRISFTTDRGAVVEDTLVSLHAYNGRMPGDWTHVEVGMETVRPYYDMVLKRGGEVFELELGSRVDVYPVD